MASPTAHIVQSLIANTFIAITKGIAAVVTGSGAMLAETLHSAADCGNQLLLLMGYRRAQKPADAKHPLGYGRALYFWSFMVAQLLFLAGGGYSIYEGVHKLMHPTAVDHVWVGLGTLAVALVIEGWATSGNIRELNRRRGTLPFFTYLRQTKDSSLIVVFGENSAAVLGLAIAMVFLALAAITGDGRYDGAGTLAVGVVLVLVALFLAVEVKALLLGEAADPTVAEAVRAELASDEKLVELLSLLTLQQGPGQILVAAKVRIHKSLDADEVCAAINAFEERVRVRVPDVKWCYVEPDIEA